MDRHGSNFGLINILLLILLYKYIVFPFLYSSSRPLETLKLFSCLLDLAEGGSPKKKLTYTVPIFCSPPQETSFQSGVALRYRPDGSDTFDVPEPAFQTIRFVWSVILMSKGFDESIWCQECSVNIIALPMDRPLHDTQREHI